MPSHAFFHTRFGTGSHLRARRLRAQRLRARLCAFTLIELLVVISIIALLIALLLPALTHARQLGISISCGSQLRQIHLGMMLYAEDNDGWGHHAFQWSTNNWVRTDNPSYFHEYWAKPVDVHVCPGTDPRAGRSGRLDSGGIYSSYSMMFGVGNHTNQDWWFGLNNMTNPVAFTPNLNMLGRHVRNGNHNRFLPEPYHQPAFQDSGRVDPRTWNERSGLGGVQGLANNHWTLDVKNTIFMDGHVESHHYDEIEIISAAYQRHVGVPRGWLDEVGP